MKKIFLSLNILLFLCAAINSCIYDKVSEKFEEEPEPPEPPQPGETKKYYYLTFVTGQIEEVNTYAIPEIEYSTPVMLWNESDAIGVFMKGDDGTELSSNRKYEMPLSVSGNRSGTLYDSITTSLPQALCYGYTPYKTSISGTELSHTLNSVQDQSAASSKMDVALKDNILMIAPASPYFELNQGIGSMQFENVFAFLRFQVTKSSSFNSFNFQKITGVKLYVANENEPETPLDDYVLAGDYHIDVSKAPSMSGYTGPEFTSVVNNITATVTGGNSISTSTTGSPYVWFVVNPLEIKENERLFSFVETTDGYVIISAHAISSLKANNVYTFNVEASESNTISDQVVVYYDDQQASNCYIVPRAGVCQIPLKTISGADLRGDTVEWLWASKEGGRGDFDIEELIDPASLQYSEAGGGYVRFRVGTDLGKYTEGNVILALKDADDNIVWTWHIWITGGEVEDEDVLYSKIFLNRNIGALSADTLSPAIDTYGFVYQWGRKDPFIGGDGQVFDESTGVLSVARAHSIINPANTWGADAENVKKWSQAEASSAGTLEASVKYPMRFIYNGTSSSEHDPADWLSVSNPGLWSDNEKTDYDPCPYGYKVPAREDFSMLYSAFGEYLYYLEHPQSTLPLIWFYNRDNSNRYWMYSYQGASAAWPIAGMRQGRHASGKWIGAQLKYSGNDRSMGHGYYWTSTPWIMRGLSYSINMRGTVLYSNDTSGPNADAYPVRCVQYP